MCVQQCCSWQYRRDDYARALTKLSSKRCAFSIGRTALGQTRAPILRQFPYFNCATRFIGRVALQGGTSFFKAVCLDFDIARKLARERRGIARFSKRLPLPDGAAALKAAQADQPTDLGFPVFRALRAQRVSMHQDDKVFHGQVRSLAWESM